MRYQEDQGPPLFTFAMLAVFLAFFAAQYKQFDMTRFYAYPWRVAGGEWWRLITCTVLHGGLLHIVFNLVMFVRLCGVIDNWLGPWAALAIYLFLAVSSTAAQSLISDTPFLMGASGVVYGLFGFLWVMSRRRDDAAAVAGPHTAETLFAWLVICAVVNYFGGNIGNTAHLMGLLLGWMVGRTFVATKRRRIPMALATVVVWAIPLVLIQPAVWGATLGRVLPFSRMYLHSPYYNYPGMRERYEDPENAPRIELLPSGRPLPIQGPGRS